MSQKSKNSVNSKNNFDENNSIIKTSSMLDTQSLYKILIKNPYLVNTIDDKKETLLSYSIKNNNINISKLILTSPILDLDFLDKDGNSYLHLAVLYKQEEIIKLLIEKGISINKQNKEGNTALHLAYVKYDKKIINILEENGIDTNIVNNKNKIAEEMTFKKSAKSFNTNIITNHKYSNNNTKTNIDNKNKNLDINNIMINQSRIKKEQNNNKINSNNIADKKHGINKSISSTKSSLKSKNKQQGDININNIKEKKVNIISNNQLDTYEDILSIDDYKSSQNENTNNKKISDFEKTIKIDWEMAKNEENNFINYNSNRNKDSFYNEQDIVNFEDKDSNSFSGEIKKNENNDNKIKANKKYNSNINTNRTSPKSKKGKLKKLLKNIGRNSNKNSCLNSVGINNNYTMKSEQRYNKNSSDKPNQSSHNKLDISASTKNINYSNELKMNSVKQDNKIYNEKKDIRKNKNIINNDEKRKTFPINNQKHLSSNNNNMKQEKNNSYNINIKSSNLGSSLITQSHLKSSSQKRNNPLVEFLSQINLIKYFDNMDSNGFDDINILIDEAKKGALVKDQELKEAGILIPGDRAKILIRLKEKANIFGFAVPKGVYHTCLNLEEIEKDKHIMELNKWLKSLKVDVYLMNFVNNGYHSLDLLLMQMETESPLNTEMLKDEIGIYIIGHRSRILNKLKEEGKNLNYKLKTSTLVVNRIGDDKNCECIIF